MDHLSDIVSRLATRNKANLVSVDQETYIFINATAQDLAQEFHVLIQQRNVAKGLEFMDVLTRLRNYRNVRCELARSQEQAVLPVSWY